MSDRSSNLAKILGVLSLPEPEEDRPPDGILARILASGVARPPSPMFGYTTPLHLLQEMAFRQWLKEGKNDPRQYFNPDQQNPDYDMRGFYKAQLENDPRAQSSVDPYDKRVHFTDPWKTPLHESFSDQSMWAGPNAPSWNNRDQLVNKQGQVVKDPIEEERKYATIRAILGRIGK